MTILSSKRLIIFGAGGQARVALQVARSLRQWSEIVFVDQYSGGYLQGCRVFGESEIAIQQEDHIHLAIGTNSVRANLAERFHGIDNRFATLVSPEANIAVDVQVGFGTIIMPGACINTGAVIGCHSIVNTGAVIEHDCRVRDFTSIGPGAVLCGAVTVDEMSMVGAGATVLQTLSVARYARVAAGAVVIDNVVEGSTVYGVPARSHKDKT